MVGYKCGIRARSLCMLFLLALLLVSCSSTDTPTTDTETATDTAEHAVTSPETVHAAPETPPVTFDGAAVRVLCEENGTSSDLYFSEEDVSVRSHAAHARDAAIEQKHDLTISYEVAADVFSTLKRSHASDDAPHAVYASGSGGMSDLMLYGYLGDIGDFADRYTGMSASALRQLSINGSLYVMTGTPIRTAVSSTVVLGYSRRTLREYGFGEDYIERLTDDRMWTHDAMHIIAKVCAVDAVSADADSLYYLWQGMGATTVEKLPGDVPSISVYSPRNVYLFTHVHDYHSDASYHADGMDALFTIDMISRVGETLGSDISIAPLPAYEEGGEYICTVRFADTYFTAIPAGHVGDDLSLSYLDALYSESVDTVYTETLREYAYGNSRMLDVILRARYFDLLDMYGIGHIVRSAFAPDTDTGDFDSLLAERAEFAERALDITLGQTLKN